MVNSKKPLPTPDGDSKFYWESCQKEKLMIQQCMDCDEHIFYPRIVCPHCMSDQLNWVEASGRGKIYSYTIARRGAGPAFSQDAPYVVALVELDEGVRILSNIIEVDVEEVHCEMKVQALFQDREGMKIPMFQPI